MFFLPSTAVINQPINPIISTTIDFALGKKTSESDVKTFYVKTIGTTATTENEIAHYYNQEVFEDSIFDLAISSVPKVIETMKVKVIKVTEFQPKVFL